MTSDATLSFSKLPLREELLKSLASLQFEEMTPIQMQSLPFMLDNQDVIAQAKTGTGKTAAFGLSILNHLKVAFFGAQALILCPTRELAEQVSGSLRRLACMMPNVKVINLSGGIPMKPQLDSLRHGAHIIVGTPGRVLKHVRAESLSLAKVKTLVLDEADRMLDMGFFDDIKTIIYSCPKKRQTLLFSATFTDEIKLIAQQFMNVPQEVHVKSQHTQLDIEQRFYEVSNLNDKLQTLKSLLLHYKLKSTLIFCNTKQQTADVTDFLAHAGFSTLALHGDMEQIERDLAVIRFTNQSCLILVATDVAARGLDIKELPAVINFDLAFEKDVHIHRIGRTGRAGNKGLALSLTTPKDALRMTVIEEDLSYPISFGNVAQLNTNNAIIPSPEMVTLCLYSGKKDKIRAGDILGALTKDAGIIGDAIGKITITTFYSYVAIQKKYADKAYQYLQTGKLKGRSVTAKYL